MVNPWAGEVSLVVDGVEYPCKLTLGALAELEDALESDSLMALVQRFETQAFSSRDVMALVVAGLRGGGWQGSKSDLLQADIAGGPMMAARKAAQMLARAFHVPQDAG